MTPRRLPTLLLAVLTLATAALAAGTVRLRPLPPIDADAKGGGMKEPSAVAFDGVSTLVVADTGNGRLLTYTVAGDKATPKAEIRLPELPYPIRVQITRQGRILALDGKHRRIVRIAPSGTFDGYLEAGAAAGDIVPRSFAIDRDGALYLLDIFRARVLVLDPQGRTLRQIGYPPDAGFLSDVAVDGHGTLFAIDSVGRRVYAARKDATVLAPFGASLQNDAAFPTALAVDGAGRLFIADEHGGGIVILGPEGGFRGRQASMGWKEGALRYPSGLCMGPNGILVVADRENDRVQMFAISE
jgi:DNA-binding beta-propeller fold protein YncE